MDAFVTIRNTGDRLAVAPGATILETALAAGVAYPHGCQSGNCGACKSRRWSGEVEMTDFSEYALEPAERAADLILACRATVWSDAEVAWIDGEDLALHPLRRLMTRVVGLDDLTHDIKRLRLAVEGGGPFTFDAGQFAKLAFADLPPRDYSMANRPDEPVLEFHLRLVAGGLASRHAAERLRAGDAVAVEGPFGNAHLRASHRGPILALAGGSGLAPMLSIIRTALAAGGDAPIRLWFGARGARDVYHEAELADLARRHRRFSFAIALSDAPPGDSHRAGLVHAVALADLAEVAGAKLYMAGPPAMIDAATAAFVARGLSLGDIHADAFTTAADRLAAAP